MKAKQTACPNDASLLVVENGDITCEQGCPDLPKLEGWNLETREILRPIIDWQKGRRTIESACPCGDPTHCGVRQDSDGDRQKI